MFLINGFVCKHIRCPPPTLGRMAARKQRPGGDISNDIHVSPSLSGFWKDDNRVERVCHGVIFRSANKPVRQPSPSLDSAFSRQSHSCLPSN